MAERAVGFLEGGGEMGERIRAFDWASSELGPASSWPGSLRTAVSIVLGSRYPMFVWWGKGLVNFYNDAYIPVLGQRHPRALGRPAHEIWSEIWDVLGPQADIVLKTGQATWNDRQLLVMERNGYTEETYFSWSYSPVADESGAVNGVFCACTEDTERVLSERRLRTLSDLGARTREESGVRAACEEAARQLEGNPHDLPFAAIYLLESGESEARLAAGVRIGGHADLFPPALALGSRPWPLAEAVAGGDAQVVQGLSRLQGIASAPWPEAVEQALVLPLAAVERGQPAGFFIAGISARRVLDSAYRRFLDLVAGHIEKTVSGARAYEAEKRRAETLAEVDRAKTAFFSNVSHEFRTPLTLMLGPVEDLLAASGDTVPADNRASLEVVRRNGQRLLKLVNTLLDFARIEAGRTQASYEPVDLAALTAELASNFRAACERAGLTLTVDCPPGEAAYVDREMWEKIVLNLLSNAFKFTLQGEIGVDLRQAADHFELAVRDTGSGIPAAELPRMFERFHRVEGALGRSHEGSGIGLALVQELVKLHGGSIGVESTAGEGSTFTVRIPKGRAHLPAERIKAERGATSTALRADAYVDEALSWLPAPTYAGVAPAQAGAKGGPRILLADDNADLRDYARRLLEEHYAVEAVGDGEAALAAARARRPDLVVSDVMMPRLDGFGLIRGLRADPALADVPVILLSARAGEEARIEGLGKGADDYLVKPFSARELLVRAGALLKSAELRRHALAEVRDKLDEMETLLRALPVGVFIARDAAGTDISMNPAGAAMLRIAPDANASKTGPGAAQLPFRVLKHGVELAGEDLPMQRAARLGEPVVGEEVEVRFADGSAASLYEYALPLFDAAGKVRGSVGVFVDITERKRAEHALRESEMRFRNMADAAPAMLWVTERDGACSFLSRGWYEFTGQTPAEALGSGWVNAVHPEDRERTGEMFRDASRRGEAFAMDYRLRRKGGEYRWAIDAGRPRLGAGGEPLGFIGSVIDVHERVLAEQALKQADARKDEFIATLSHELRNPLAPLSNSLQVLKLTGASGADAQPLHEMMERQVSHLVRLVDDLLEMARISRGRLELRRERVEVATVVRNALETSEPLLQAAGHTLSVALPPEALWVDGDPVRLAQILANLLNNAAKYTQRGGAVAVQARREGALAAITVRDNGPGIAPEALAAIFEMFSRGQRGGAAHAHGGLGIGLALARRLAEMHGGTLEARSEGAGKGAEFTLRVPLAAQGAARADRGARTDAALPGRRILVVDDNRDAADSLAMLLKLLGADVHVVHDGASALAAFESYRPAAVLLDIGMPGMDGYTVARTLRQKLAGRSVPIVAISGWGQEDDRRRAREAGFDHHLVKPPDMTALRSLLGSLH